VINQYRKTALLGFGSSASFEAGHILTAGYQPHVFGEGQRSAAFVPPVSGDLALSAGGPKAGPPHAARGAAREHSSAGVLW